MQLFTLMTASATKSTPPVWSPDELCWAHAVTLSFHDALNLFNHPDTSVSVAPRFPPLLASFYFHERL